MSNPNENFELLNNINKNLEELSKNVTIGQTKSNKNIKDADQRLQTQITGLKEDMNKLQSTVDNLVNPDVNVTTTFSNKISISIIYFKENPYICSGNIPIINPEDNSDQFDSLEEAVDSLNVYIHSNDLIYVSSVDIRLGPGITWVNKSGQRTYNKIPGDQYYSSSPKIQTIGRKETTITRLTMTGFGQGTSTIMGSWLANVYNLQSPPEKVITNANYTCDNLQFTCRLIINNLFWQGQMGFNVIYNTDGFENINPPPVPSESEPLSYFDCSNNYYNIDNANDDEIAKFTLNKKVEVILVNLLIELNLPNKPLDSPPSLDYPLFYLNTPVLGRLFISQTNITSYVKPDKMGKDYGTTVFFGQFVQSKPTNTFIQTCSFSTRIFGEFNYISLGIINHDKVSILDSQFSGQLNCKSDKLSIFGCYLLGIGPKEGDYNFTTNGVYMSSLDSFARGSSKLAQRFIASSCEYVSTVYWGKGININNGSQVCKFLKDGGKSSPEPDEFDENYTKRNPVLPWKLEQKVISVLFTNISFYMVNMEGEKTKKDNHSNLITLTNSIATCDFSSGADNLVSITPWGSDDHLHQ